MRRTRRSCRTDPGTLPPPSWCSCPRTSGDGRHFLGVKSGESNGVQAFTGHPHIPGARKELVLCHPRPHRMLGLSRLDLGGGARKTFHGLPLIAGGRRFVLFLCFPQRTGLDQNDPGGAALVSAVRAVRRCRFPTPLIEGRRSRSPQEFRRKPQRPQQWPRTGNVNELQLRTTPGRKPGWPRGRGMSRRDSSSRRTRHTHKRKDWLPEKQTRRFETWTTSLHPQGLQGMALKATVIAAAIALSWH